MLIVTIVGDSVSVTHCVFSFFVDLTCPEDR
jgi:hypothetical protein